MENARLWEYRADFRKKLPKERQRAEDERRLRKLAEAQAKRENEQLHRERLRAD